MEKDTFTLRDVFRREHSSSILVSLLLLALAYIVEHFANIYAYAISQRPTSNHVGDLILDNIPVMDLNLIIINFALIATAIAVLYLVSQPRYILFTLKSLALFIIVRAFFISLTHVGIHPEAISPGLGFFDAIYLYLNFQTGLFFSGHTGLPFLMALIFWQKPRTRNIFLVLSLIFGTAVILAHVHYSIDVFAAPFMAFGIFHIAMRFFPRDYDLIRQGTGMSR